jgi:hypothetical protein
LKGAKIRLGLNIRSRGRVLKGTERRLMTTPSNASIAAIVGSGSRSVQSLFAALAGDLRAEGLRVIGVVSETHGLADRTCSAGFLRDIVTSAEFPIYLQEPPRDTWCHLDASGVDAACRELLPQIRGCGDLVIISKFGKLEAGGGGLTQAHQPILTSVSELHLEAWRAFAPSALDVACDGSAVRRWWETLDLSRVGLATGAPSPRIAPITG